MSETSDKKSSAPIILIVAAIVVVILAVVFWPETNEQTQPEVAVQEEPAVADEPEEFSPAPEPEPVEIDPEAEVEPMPEPEPQPEPEPLDTSDKGVQEALSDISDSEQVNSLLVNEGLIQRFVVTVTNLANDEMVAIPQQPLAAPDQEFRVYSQAGKQWIDAASYKRYTPYVELMESFDNDALLNLFDRYEEEIQSKYAEIGDPDKPFEKVMVEAIDQLLDTPEVPVPVEVYSDSVAYKYADPQLESLSEPQKQLLRTGPDNMRRIKAKLRELQDVLQSDGSQ